MHSVQRGLTRRENSIKIHIGGGCIRRQPHDVDSEVKWMQYVVRIVLSVVLGLIL